MTTMLLGSLWHGAGWTFMIWGGLHGLYLVVNHLSRDIKDILPYGREALREIAVAGGKKRGLCHTLTRISARLLTFTAVLVAWVFFRAQSFPHAFKVLRGMVGLSGVKLGQMAYLPDARYKILTLLALFLLVNFAPNTLEISRNFRPNWLWLFFLVVVCLMAVLNMNTISEFLYVFLIN